MVSVIKLCKGPLRSTSSPAPPAAHGTKTVKLMSLISLTCFAALAGTVKSASAAKRSIIVVVFFFIGSFLQPKGKVILADTPHQTRARMLAIAMIGHAVRFALATSREFFAQAEI